MITIGVDGHKQVHVALELDGPINIDLRTSPLASVVEAHASTEIAKEKFQN